MFTQVIFNINGLTIIAKRRFLILILSSRDRETQNGFGPPFRPRFHSVHFAGGTILRMRRYAVYFRYSTSVHVVCDGVAEIIHLYF